LQVDILLATPLRLAKLSESGQVDLDQVCT
jgi:hypothetical protein